MKKIISSTGAPKAVGPYSQAVEAGGTLYISGQLPVNPADGTVPPTIEEQTARSLENIKAILSEAGYSLDDAVKMTVLLDDIGNFGAMNGVYAKYFTGDMPARVCYQVAALPMGVKVEIETIAVKK
jgi:2-iminobutanoate/2-iminopropanoate deaminase